MVRISEINCCSLILYQPADFLWTQLVWMEHTVQSPLASCSSPTDTSFIEALVLFFKADISCPQVTLDQEDSKAAKEKVTVDLQGHPDSQVCKKSHLLHQPVFFFSFLLNCLQPLRHFVELQLFQQRNRSVLTSEPSDLSMGALLAKMH